jgi:hypothetical protein
MFLIDIMDVVAGLEIHWLLQCRLWLPSMWLESETEDATGTWKLTELMHRGAARTYTLGENACGTAYVTFRDESFLHRLCNR